MTHPFDPPTRRGVLQYACALGAAAVLPAQAQPGKPGTRGITVAQIVDTSSSQQDVSKDFLIGSRAAWQDINSRGGLRGKPVQHLSVEVDGTASSIRNALQALQAQPGCVVLSGTAGDQTATQVAHLLRQDNFSIAHVAPWLQNSSVEIDERTFPIFAARQEQISHAMKSLSVIGMHEVGAVYATDAEHAFYRDDMERIAAAMKLKLHSFRANGEIRALGQRLTQTTPAVLIFVGGTPELAQFTLGLDRQARQRYVVALADVNLQTMAQMGAARTTPIIATQAVPVVTAGLPVVRAYREALNRLFDEPPAALSLAGFIAARYTYDVLNDLDASPTRASVLTAFQRRSPLDVGGYRVAFNPQGRSSAYVTQSMLTADGRVVG